MAATRLYTVHEKGGLEGEVEFVREGFSVLAFLFTVIWLWVHHAWLAGMVVLGVVLFLVFGGTILGVPLYLNIAILVAICMGIGIFGRDFQRAVLARRGFVETGVSTGESIEEAEMRYFGKRINQLAATSHTAAPVIPA